MLNDLSLHGQYPDIESFQRSIALVMQMRLIAKRYGRELHAPRNFAIRPALFQTTMVRAIQQLTRDQQRSILQWVQKEGPFWEDSREHDGDEYLECRGQIVTDCGLGHAAYGCGCGITRNAVSLDPSDWLHTPLEVLWWRDSDRSESILVGNHWHTEPLEAALREAPVPLESWDGLEAVCRQRFERLTIAGDAFVPLAGRPFHSGGADRVITLLDTLNRLARCFDATGLQTAEGRQIYQDHFTGNKPWFTDSSDTEKNTIADQFVFTHPERPGEVLCCTWHGKVRTPVLRIHFSWPIQHNSPVFIVYVGPHITKR